jgi:hypothetical protein
MVIKAMEKERETYTPITDAERIKLGCDSCAEDWLCANVSRHHNLKSLEEDKRKKCGAWTKKSAC